MSKLRKSSVTNGADNRGQLGVHCIDDMPKSNLKMVAPATKSEQLWPRRRRNGDLRTREYLTEAEVERLMEAATDNRHGHRDVTLYTNSVNAASDEVFRTRPHLTLVPRDQAGSVQSNSPLSDSIVACRPNSEFLTGACSEIWKAACLEAMREWRASSVDQKVA
jgi:hypothetical protein